MIFIFVNSHFVKKNIVFELLQISKAKNYGFKAGQMSFEKNDWWL